MCKFKLTKSLSVLLSVLILCSIVFSTNVFAEVSVNSDFVRKETILDENRIYLHNPTNTYYEIAGFSETANVENITKLMLEDGETDKIGKEAFKNNPYIEEIYLDNKDITYNYSGNYSVHSGMRSIGESAFENCTALKKVGLYFSEKIHSIGRINIVEICNSAFRGCTSLEEFEVPASVTYIDSKAFADCTSLKKIAIYEYTTEIADDAFENCNNLTIYGKTNSSAHEYAKKNNIPFVSISYKENAVIEFYYSIMYMHAMLKCNVENNYILGVYPSSSAVFPTTNFQEYYFSYYWADELHKELSKAKQVFENPFLTNSELLTAMSKAQEAIYKAELIEELGRLIEPTSINSSWIFAPPIYHHEGACSYCLKAMELFGGYRTGWPYVAPLTYESNARYLKLKKEITELLESNNYSYNDISYSLRDIKYTLDTLMTTHEEYLITTLSNLCTLDFNLYTNETVNVLKEYMSQAQDVIYMGYYYEDSFVYQKHNLDYAISNLRLISFNELERKWYEYNNIYQSREIYKYTLDSFLNFSNELDRAYYDVIMPYYSISYDRYGGYYPSIDPPYGYPFRTPYEAHLQLNNDVVVEQLEKLTGAYNSLELKPLGDVNQDGINSVTDVIYTLKSVVGATRLYEESQYFADMNSDGKVTVLDAVLLQRDILEMT